MIGREIIIAISLIGLVLTGWGTRIPPSDNADTIPPRSRLEMLRQARQSSHLYASTGQSPSPSDHLDGVQETNNPSSTDAPPEWSSIVYQSSASGTGDLYLVNGNGANNTPLLTGTTQDQNPSYARDGSRIFFSRKLNNQLDLYSIRPDATGLTRITNSPGDDYNAVSSPDSTRLVFQSTRNGNSDLYSINANGTNTQQLTQNPAYDGEPAWSPDGSNIVFISNRGGDYDLWLMNSDGAPPRQITHGANAFTTDWSPGGDQIAFSQDSDNNGWLEVWLVGSDGVGLKRYTPDNYGSTDFWNPAWSPDGRYMAMVKTVWSFANNQWVMIFSNLIILDQNAIPYNTTAGDWVFAVDWAAVDTSPPNTCSVSIPSSQPTRGKGAIFSLLATDNGPSGITAYEVESRPLPAGTWKSLYPWRLAPGGVYADGEYGRGELRCRAIDAAGNRGNWTGAPYPQISYDGSAPDSIATTSTIHASEGVTVTIRANDFGSGVLSYDLYSRQTGGNWQIVESNIQPGSSVYFTSQAGTTQEIRSQAHDLAGNIETWSPLADDVITFTLPVTNSNGEALAGISILDDPEYTLFFPTVLRDGDLPETINPLNDWPLFALDEKHTSYNKLEAGASRYSLAWSLNLDLPNCAYFHEINIAEGVLVASLNDCFVRNASIRGLDSRDGHQLWRIDYPAFSDVEGASIKYGRVFYKRVGDTISTFYSVDVHTGNQRWQAGFAAQDTYLSPLVSGPNVYIGSDAGLLAFDVSSGKKLWTAYVPRYQGGWTPAFISDSVSGDPRLVTWINGIVNVHGLSNGNIDWGLSLPVSIHPSYNGRSPVIAGKIALLQSAQILYALDLETREVVWSLPGISSSLYSGYGQPAVAEDVVYVVLDGILKAIRLTDGTELWRFIGDGLLDRTPVLTQNYIYVASPSRTFVVDRLSHQEVWQTAQAGWLVVADGYLYIGTPTNMIYAYRAEEP